MVKTYRLDSSPPNQIRRKEYAQDDDWIRDFLASVQVGHVATRWEEQPFITPMTFWYDPERNQIYLHSNLTGRLRTNCERHERVCFEASQVGKALPSNVALEFGIQYASVVAFGRINLLHSDEEKRRALYGLIRKYFPGMKPGKHYRPITDKELKRTAVYAISIDSWSGKLNWKEKAEQSQDWQSLDQEWFG
jgi:nitroimidazol reductase NimA-like FMN-containing flavoprotein (pyridoxamine 5'-phosphate oxidase superfamily)